MLVTLNLIEDAALLSLAQERLWLLHRLDPADATYNLTRVFRLEGALDAAALERALEELAWRHAILRTRFDERDRAPQQVVLSRPTLRLTREAFQPGEAALAERIREETRRPFDLSAGPPARRSAQRCCRWPAEGRCCCWRCTTSCRTVRQTQTWRAT
ncbi:condensation domain-containing protein [Azospirillum sp. TSO5]|uniref:condensation domain-containing protein n=1 Tax=Azospirillum sp. TSO5 TaxID=716760 RepID=UPI000D65A048|nr:condensation domain-containing protein [Azospirillum sp. TSO5]